MNKEQIIAWLNNETMRNQVYHNHKENMAWVATALYVSGAFILGLQLESVVSKCPKCLTVAVVTLITGLAFCFVCWQFNKRKIASERVEKLIETVHKLFPKPLPDAVAWYFEKMETHKNDVWVSVIISLLAMIIAYISFLMLACF